jgi:cell division protein FtsB
MNRAIIQARRDALAQQYATAQQQHTELQNTIHLLEHNISGMQGGLQELDALLALPDEPAHEEPPTS